MKLAVRFWIAELVWATGIFALIVVAAILGSDEHSAAHVLRWLVRALTLAAFPAAIALAPAIVSAERSWHALRSVLAAIIAVSVVAFLLVGILAPLVSNEARTLSLLATQMRSVGEGWETRNDAAWVFFTTLFAPLNTLLFAAIGIQVRIWGDHALPPPLRRALYWTVGLGLLITGAGVWDTTYETVVLHTAAYAGFAAFYTIIAPLSICAGLALPTLALLRGAVKTRDTG